MASTSIFRLMRKPVHLKSCSFALSSPSTRVYIHTHQGPINAATPQQVNNEEDGEKGAGGKDTISRAMQSYIQRAREHQEFMDRQEKEFVFGRRHLANMMGKDPENFTQQDIDEAIRYLFPSGLFEPKARPIMRPPQEVYPRQKAAQFDLSGRPHHPFFYTAAPNFYHLMHEMVGKLQKMSKSGGGLLTLDDPNYLPLAGSVWLSKEELESKLMEKLNDKQYKEWVSCLERIVLHPEREKELEFLKSYRKELAKQGKAEDFPPITLEPDGRKSCHVPLCMKKTARGEVKVTVPGTGRININGQGLDFFKAMQSKQIFLTPLQLVGWLGKADVDAYVMGGTENCEHQSYGGETARAGCLRWGIATALAALGADVDKLRLAGLLVRDRRLKERKKPGHVGARARWTWKKR